MNKVIIAVLAMITLVACDSRPIDQRGYTKHTLNGIPELADCIYIALDNNTRVIRCPNSATATNYSVTVGKQTTNYTTTVVSE